MSQRGGEWLASRRVAPFYVMVPEPYRPHLVVWVEAATGKVPGFEIILPDATSAEAAEALVRAMGMFSKSRFVPPRSVCTDDPDLAAALAPRLVPATPVRLGPALEVDDVINAMARDRPGTSEAGGYLEGGRIPEPTVARFFEAAAGLFRVAPWSIVQDDGQILRLDAPGFGVDAACVNIIGGLGQELGFLVFESIDDFARFMTIADEADAPEPADLDVPLFAVNFDRRKDLTPSLQKDVRRHGWSVADPRGHPWIVSTDADGVVRPLTERDYLFATACLEALAVFFTRHRDLFEAVAPEAVTETVALDDVPGAAVVRLTAPHPEAWWVWGEETPVDVERRDAAGDIVAAFMVHEHGAGRSEAWLREAQDTVEDLLSFKIDVGGEPALGWTEDLVEEYLRDRFDDPAGVSDVDVAMVPEHVDAFFAWLGATDQEDKPMARGIGDTIAARRWAEAPRDPGGRRASTARWVWTGDTPAPEPAGPCPCGSGARYRKCCRPR